MWRVLVDGWRRWDGSGEKGRCYGRSARLYESVWVKQRRRRARVNDGEDECGDRRRGNNKRKPGWGGWDRSDPGFMYSGRAKPPITARGRREKSFQGLNSVALGSRPRVIAGAWRA